MRADLVLRAARGRSNARIASESGLHVDTVRTWRGRLTAGGLPALEDRERSGRPPRFTPLQTAEVKARAWQLPGETGIPLSHWSCPELAREAVDRGSWRRSRPPPCAAGSSGTRSSPGSTTHGSSFATPTSVPMSPASWTSTPASGSVRAFGPCSSPHRKSPPRTLSYEISPSAGSEGPVGTAPRTTAARPSRQRSDGRAVRRVSAGGTWVPCHTRRPTTLRSAALPPTPRPPRTNCGHHAWAAERSRDRRK
ncbi:helix-turn-helix domain-containing protein [Streptomyces sp. NPDC046977]|uniref:helix-turn-helix domain-containing protein n=1 Tax=Streptomyces sp. NPDC046977 TaxID=3154703 RepID=UPI003408F4BB